MTCNIEGLEKLKSIIPQLENMLKYLLSFALVLWWMIILQKIFPSDHDRSTSYTILMLMILAVWVIAGVVALLMKIKAPSWKVFSLLVLVNFVVIYNVYPWYNGYGGIQIVRDYSQKKKSIKQVPYSWSYDLPERIENYSLIDMAEQKFASEIKPGKCYLFRCFYYDDKTIEQDVYRCVIYFKDKKLFTTNPEIAVLKNADGGYCLSQIVDGKEMFSVVVRDSAIGLVSVEDGKEVFTNQYRDNISVAYGKYGCSLRQSNNYNQGSSIREKYWIYKLF